MKKFFEEAAIEVLKIEAVENTTGDTDTTFSDTNDDEDI